MNVLVVSPHPDDEVLGAGGTLLRYKSQGYSVAWLIVTSLKEEFGWSPQKISERNDQIFKVAKFFNFQKVFDLELPTTRLDTLPMAELVQKISEVINSFCPEEILVPYLGDIHSDHKIVYNAVLSSSKSFRCPFVKRVLAYETLSETNFCLDPNHNFNPNVFIDISDYLDLKINAMEIYSSEMAPFPFPRSRISIESLARYRGSSSGFMAAEAFQLLRQRI